MQGFSNSGSIKGSVYGLIFLFVLVFILGFFELGGKILLLNASTFSVYAIVFLVKTNHTKVPARLKSILVFLGFSSLIFSLGLIYGIFGIWGYYSINDIAFVGLTGLSWLAFILCSTRALMYFRKNDDYLYS